jgi:hypothetical protein
MKLKFELNTKKNITAIRALTKLVLNHNFLKINWLFLEAQKLTGELERY